ncbi:TPA: hypothetical protein RQN22_001829 [Aeromonas dhakensis]|nr:hypothetical protein [Aeromonas dhakensis]
MPIKREGNRQSEAFEIQSIQLESTESSYDITDTLVSMTINESLDGLMSGAITINNKIGLFDQRDFGGKDNILIIKMKSTSKHKPVGKTFERRFRVTNYSDKFSNDSNTSFSILGFKSLGTVNNNFHRVSKSYANTGTHAIVSDMLKLIGYTEKDIKVETTMFNRDIVIPNITPLETIQFLKQHSISGESKNKGDSDFYFFENRDAINFVSRTALLSRDPVAMYNVCLDVDKTEQNIAMSFTLDRGYNIESQVNSGAYGLTVISHSLMDKSIKHVRALPDGIQSMNEKSATNIDFDSNYHFIMATEDQMYQYQNMSSNGNSIANREISRARLNEKRAFMNIGADSDITVGDQITLLVDGANGQSKNSGKWLVSKIVHTVTKTSWIMELLIVSDGTTITLNNTQSKPKTKDEKAQ